jgi:hypothetical protein
LRDFKKWHPLLNLEEPAKTTLKYGVIDAMNAEPRWCC